MIDKSKFYGTIAEDFDAIMNRYDLERRVQVVFDELLAAHSLEGCSLLDAGCGTGHFSVRAQQRGAEVISLDIATPLLAVTRRKGVQRVVTGSVLSLPFDDGCFDYVISSECIEHTPSPEDAVRELCRVVRPGGTVVITCPNYFWYWSCALADKLGIRPYSGFENWPRWTQLRRWVTAAGISVEQHRGLHMFPFQLSFTHALLRRLDAAGARLGRVYVNQCIAGVKQQR